MNATGMPAAHADRDIRQREIVPPEKLAGCHVVVVGVGAIGRQVALQLAAVGVPSLELFDHDTVEVENLAAAGVLATGPCPAQGKRHGGCLPADLPASAAGRPPGDSSVARSAGPWVTQAKTSPSSAASIRSRPANWSGSR